MLALSAEDRWCSREPLVLLRGLRDRLSGGGAAWGGVVADICIYMGFNHTDGELSGIYGSQVLFLFGSLVHFTLGVYATD